MQSLVSELSLTANTLELVSSIEKAVQVGHDSNGVFQVGFSFNRF